MPKSEYENIAEKAKGVAESVTDLIEVIPGMSDQEWLYHRQDTINVLKALLDGFIQANIKMIELGLELENGD